MRGLGVELAAVITAVLRMVIRVVIRVVISAMQGWLLYNHYIPSLNPGGESSSPIAMTPINDHKASLASEPSSCSLAYQILLS